MKFCSNCGNEIIISENKFCPNCGAKINLPKRTNKIDENLDKVSKGVNVIKSEIAESEYIATAKENTKVVFKSFRQISATILGYIGFVITSVLLVNHFFNDKEEWYLVSSYNYHFPSGFSLSEFPFYIAENLIIILSFVFMYLLGKRKIWLMFITGCYIVVFLSLTINGISSKNEVENENVVDERKGIIEEYTIEPENEVKYHNNYHENREIAYEEFLSGSFFYDGNNYNYKLLTKNVGDTKLLIYKKDILYFEYEYYSLFGNEKITFEDDFFSMEYTTGAGSSGLISVNYFLFDISNKQKYSLSKSYYEFEEDNYEIKEYEGDNLEKIKENSKVFNFFKRKLPKLAQY